MRVPVRPLLATALLVGTLALHAAEKPATLPVNLLPADPITETSVPSGPRVMLDAKVAESNAASLYVELPPAVVTAAPRTITLEVQRGVVTP
jgi:hypothetical protein